MNTVFDKLGLPKHLTWGYLGVLIFMMSDGIEQGWLSPYLVDRGMSVQHCFAVYRLRHYHSHFGMVFGRISPPSSDMCGAFGGIPPTIKKSLIKGFNP